jgi:hypothetical protein
MPEIDGRMLKAAVHLMKAALNNDYPWYVTSDEQDDRIMALVHECYGGGRNWSHMFVDGMIEIWFEACLDYEERMDE